MVKRKLKNNLIIPLIPVFVNDLIETTRVTSIYKPLLRFSRLFRLRRMCDSCSRPSWCSFSPSAGQVQGLCVQSIRQGAPVPSSSSRAEKVLRSRTPDPSASTWRGPACRGTFSTLRHWPEYVGRTWRAPQLWSTVRRTALGRLHVSRGRLSLYSNILSGLRKLASSKFCHWTGLTEIAGKDNVALIITNKAERTKKFLKNSS